MRPDDRSCGINSGQRKFQSEVSSASTSSADESPFQFFLCLKHGGVTSRNQFIIVCMCVCMYVCVIH